MDTVTWLLFALALLVSLAAVVIAAAPRKSDCANRIRHLELELTELSDLVDEQMRSLKKLHGRQSTRAARDAKDDQGVANQVDGMDPMKRLPGETAEQWKSRMGRTVAGVPGSRRN